MPLLIDGHNLIGQLPDISLADPDDEAKLVMLLRRYTTAKRGRQAIVVFDHGVYGHPLQLDGYGVTCHFARSPQDADAQIIRRVTSIMRPGDWTLVTSDRRVAQIAEKRGVRVISAQRFAQLLTAPLRRPEEQGEGPEKSADVRLTPQEVAEWMLIFGEAEAAIEEEEDDEERMPYDPNPPVRKKRRRR
ncbi:MAG TPA: NYN domain-containing protein [Roseiflexaceae bacterium]|nr:NYN domain-containing protein [Roseiflexaceae bacterium]